MAQTAKQRAAAERARAQREIAAREKAKRKQRFYAIAASILALALVVPLVMTALIGNHSAPAPADPAQASPVPADPATPAATQPESNQSGPIAMATEAPNPTLAEGRTWTATLDTTGGEIVLELYGAEAPQAVASFIGLAREGFFNGTLCHRLTTAGIYVLQCGDPTATGGGGPNFRFGPIENAPYDNFYPAGTLAMARQGSFGVGAEAAGTSMGSQFFLVYEDSTIGSDEAGGYTVFGRIVSGLDIVQAVAEAGVAGGGPDGRPAVDFTIEGVTVQ